MIIDYYIIENANKSCDIGIVGESIDCKIVVGLPFLKADELAIKLCRAIADATNRPELVTIESHRVVK